MRKINYLFAVSTLLLSACSSSDAPGSKAPGEYRDIEFTPAEAVVAEAQNAFSTKFISQITELEAKPVENLMISPLSAGIALSILANSVDDETAADVLDLLGQSDLEALNDYNRTLMINLPVAHDSTTLSLANGIWVSDKYSVPESYATKFYDVFGDHPQSLDFKNKPNAKKVLNGWSDRQTNGMIKEICPDNIDQMEIFFANALYFKSRWKDVFDPKKTKPGKFYGVPGGSYVNVDMMNGKHYIFSAEVDGIEIAKLLFHENRYSIRFILPKKNTSVIDLVSNEEKFKEIMSAELHLGYCQMQIPKFKIDGRFMMFDYLSKYLPAFAKGHWANCGLESSLKNYTLVQHTSFNIDENGAEAAAVTSNWMIGSNFLDSFVVDRPFAFVVTEEKTGTILLAGIVNDPTKSDSGELVYM